MAKDPYAPRKGKSPHGDYPAWVDQLVVPSPGFEFKLVPSEPLLTGLDWYVKDLVDHEMPEEIRDFYIDLVENDPEMSAKFAAFRARRKLLGR